jgi:tripartite ATP-independent transporter DctP family solute receptor
MKVKKTLRLLFVILVITGIILTGCKMQSEKKVKLVWAAVSVPGDAHTRAMQVFKLELEKLSEGQMEVEVYHSGQLFSQQGQIDAMRKGTIDLAYTAVGWNAEFVPYLSMLGAVYTFSGYDHMTKVLNGEIGKKIYEDVAKATNGRPLAAYYLGTRQLNLVEKVGPVKHPDDMKGVKLRTPGSPSWIALGKALGGNPTPMSFSEVYLGLKTGVIEGQDNPLPTDKNAKFYEVTKYIVLTNHLADSVWPTINEAKWQSLSKKQQEWVIQAVEAGRKACDKQNLDNEASIRDFFVKEGMIIIDDPDREAFQAYAKNSYLTESKDISKDWDLDLYEKIQALK